MEDILPSGEASLSKQIEIACKHVLLQEPGNQNMIFSPAKITIEGTHIKRVETCKLSEYYERLKKWRDENPKLKIYERKLISPSFINAHTHIAMNLFRGLDKQFAPKGNMVEDLFYNIEKQLRAEDVRVFARMGAYENILSGVGMVWDHYYHGLELAEGISDTGLSAVIAPTLQDLSGPGKDYWQREWDHTISIHQSKKFKSLGIFAAFGPHATDTVSAKLWQKIVDKAEALNLPFHSHLSQSYEEYLRVHDREGCSPVKWLDKLGVLKKNVSSYFVHNIFVDKEDLRILKNNSSVLGFCPFSSLIFAFPSKIEEWDKLDISWALGTDCVASNDSMNIQKELKYCAGMGMGSLNSESHFREFMEGKSINKKDLLLEINKKRQSKWQEAETRRDPKHLLDKVWTIPGAMHPEVTLGKIAKNSLANLNIWDLDDPSIWPGIGLQSLAMGDTSSAIFHMMIAGKWISKEGEFQSNLKGSLEYKEHRKEAGIRFSELMKRAGLSRI